MARVAALATLALALACVAVTPALAGKRCGAKECPMADGVCCADLAHCCPAGYLCTTNGPPKCLPEKSDTLPIQELIKLQRLAERVEEIEREEEDEPAETVQTQRERADDLRHLARSLHKLEEGPAATDKGGHKLMKNLEHRIHLLEKNNVVEGDPAAEQRFRMRQPSSNEIEGASVRVDAGISKDGDVETEADVVEKLPPKPWQRPGYGFVGPVTTPCDSCTQAVASDALTPAERSQIQHYEQLIDMAVKDLAGTPVEKAPHAVQNAIRFFENRIAHIRAHSDVSQQKEDAKAYLAAAHAHKK
jgi:hypothetical protein